MGLPSPLNCLIEGEDVVQDASILDKTCLGAMDQVWKERLYSSANHMS